eukprot:4676966-Pyramimonas_sp.AAC.1
MASGSVGPSQSRRRSRDGGRDGSGKSAGKGERAGKGSGKSKNDDGDNVRGLQDPAAVLMDSVSAVIDTCCLANVEMKQAGQLASSLRGYRETDDRTGGIGPGGVKSGCAIQ